MNATVQEDVFPLGGFGLPNFPAWLFENYDSAFVALGPDTTYYIVVDGFNGNSAGNYRLNVRVGAGPLIFWSGFEADESLASAVDESQLAACSSPATRIRSRK